MDAVSPPEPLFGDQLARARQVWVHRMRRELGRLGFDDFRRSDTVVLRSLLGDPLSIAALAGIIGVTRQAARKFADGLERRGYVTVMIDREDARRLRVILSPAGTAYATAVVEVVALLDGELARRVDPAQLRAARTVLRTVIGSDVPVTGVPG
jgi:DNA-binding MarR family transcriptional regulator